jgi:hypothetical protein
MPRYTGRHLTLGRPLDANTYRFSGRTQFATQGFRVNRAARNDRRGRSLVGKFEVNTSGP